MCCYFIIYERWKNNYINNHRVINIDVDEDEEINTDVTDDDDGDNNKYWDINKYSFDFKSEIKTYKICYVDSDYVQTEREIDVLNFCSGFENVTSYYALGLHCFCHLRNEERTFLLRNIERLWVDNVEILFPFSYFWDIFNNDEGYKVLIDISRRIREIKLMVFLSRAANGQMRKEQRLVIAKYLQTFNPELDLFAAEENIKNIGCENKDFNKILRELVIYPDEKENLLSYSSEILMLKRQMDPMQKAVFEKMKKIKVM